jgi:hypothetical protein
MEGYTSACQVALGGDRMTMSIPRARMAFAASATVKFGLCDGCGGDDIRIDEEIDQSTLGAVQKLVDSLSQQELLSQDTDGFSQ